MADQTTYDFAVKRIRDALEDGRFPDAIAFILELHPADQAEVFNLLTDEGQDVLLPSLDIASTADLLEEMEDDEVLEAVEGLTTERLADVLDEMEPDEAADLIGTGGNAGQQTITLVIRALALREVLPKDAHRVWWKEAKAGLIYSTL